MARSRFWQSLFPQMSRTFRPLRAIPKSKLGSASILMAAGTIYSTGTIPKSQEMPELKHAKPTFVVTVGSLLELDYNASMAAFKAIAQKQGKDINFSKELMGQILSLDQRFMGGEIDAPEFRTQLKTLLDIEASDQEFDNAWNKMLGDTSQLEHKMAELSAIPGANVIFNSGTNPIHAAALGLEQLPVFLSYKEKCVGVECYDKLLKRYHCNPATTTIIHLVRKADHKTIESHNKAMAQALEQFGRTKSKTCCLGNGKDIATAIRERVAATGESPQPLPVLGRR